MKKMMQSFLCIALILSSVPTVCGQKPAKKSVRIVDAAPEVAPVESTTATQISRLASISLSQVALASAAVVVVAGVVLYKKEVKRALEKVCKFLQRTFGSKSEKKAGVCAVCPKK